MEGLTVLVKDNPIISTIVLGALGGLLYELSKLFGKGILISLSLLMKSSQKGLSNFIYQRIRIYHCTAKLKLRKVRKIKNNEPEIIKLLLEKLYTNVLLIISIITLLAFAGFIRNFDKTFMGTVMGFSFGFFQAFSSIYKHMRLIQAANDFSNFEKEMNRKIDRFERIIKRQKIKREAKPQD